MPYTTQLSNVAREIAAGDSLKLIQLARERNVDPSCIFRWVTKGLPGLQGRVCLEAVRIGRGWFTSRAAVSRFFSSLPQSSPTAVEQPSPVRNVRSQSQREAASEEAARILREKHGF